MKSLSEKGKRSFCRHTFGKFVPHLLLKVKLAGAGSKLNLQAVAAEDRALPVLTVTAEVWHKEWKG